MHTTHNSIKPARRYNRHNLGPNTGAALVVLDEAGDIAAVVSAAARFTTGAREAEKFDVLFVAQPTDDAAVCKAVPVAANQKRTTVFFEDNDVAKIITEKYPHYRWAEISIRGLAENSLRPESVLSPLDTNTWKVLEDEDGIRLGGRWPMSEMVKRTAANNPQAWTLVKSAATIIGGLDKDAFPHVEVPDMAELQYLQKREEKMRLERKRAAEQRRFDRLLSKLSPTERDAFIARVAANAQKS